MNVLDNLVLPQSAEHMVLLKYLLVITFILFIPYLGVLTGSVIYSLYFKRKGIRENNPVYLRFSKELADLVTFNKSIGLGMGAVPLISAAFCYAQLLHLSPVNVSGYLLISTLTLIIGLIFVYTYKHSMHINQLFKLFDLKSNDLDEAAKRDVKGYIEKTEGLDNKSGMWGLIFILVTGYLFAGAIQLAIDSARWETVTSIVGIIFSLSTFTYFLFFLSAGLSLTSVAVLFFYFRQNAEKEIYGSDYREHIKKFALRSGLIFTLAQPLLITLNLLLKPAAALSAGLFTAFLISVLLLLLLSVFFYIMIKESKVRYSSSLLYLFMVLFVFIIIKDQFAFDTASRKQFIILSDNYVQYQNKLKEELGIAVVEISGADIYNGRCIACHQFDKRLVGPPYKEVLPKYDGKMDELVKFILNPVKINPDYTAMPNQGLKPKEAEAVADYLMKTYMK